MIGESWKNVGGLRSKELRSCRGKSGQNGGWRYKNSFDWYCRLKKLIHKGFGGILDWCQRTVRLHADADGLGGVCKFSNGGAGSAASNNMKTSGSLPSSSSFFANATMSKSNSNLISLKSNSKRVSTSLQCSSGLPTATTLTANSGVQSLVTSRASESHQGPNHLSLDGLDSLRIRLVEAGAKRKSVRECTKGVTVDIALALSALKVDSLVGKGVGMGTGIALGGMITKSGKAGSSGGSCSKHSSDILLEDEGLGDEGGSEHDELVVLEAEDYMDDGSTIHLKLTLNGSV